MNNYLRAAAKKFDEVKDKDYFINPISEEDAEIITELAEIFKKMGNKDVAGILSKYKYFSDKDVRDKLIDYNIHFSRAEFEKSESGIGSLLEQGVEELKEKFDRKIEYVRISTLTLPAYLLIGYDINEEYDEDDRYIGKIIINPTDISATKQPLYANYTFTYYDEDELYEEIERFEEQLRKANVKFVDEDIAEEENNEEENDSGIPDEESDSD